MKAPIKFLNDGTIARKGMIVVVEKHTRLIGNDIGAIVKIVVLNGMSNSGIYTNSADVVTELSLSDKVYPQFNQWNGLCDLRRATKEERKIYKSRL